MKSSRHRFATLLSVAIVLGTMAMSLASAQTRPPRPPNNEQFGQPRVPTITPAMDCAKKPPIPHVPFTIAELKQRNWIQATATPTTVLTIQPGSPEPNRKFSPVGPKITVQSYLDQLNEMEQYLNSMGYSLRNISRERYDFLKCSVPVDYQTSVKAESKARSDHYFMDYKGFTSDRTLAGPDVPPNDRNKVKTAVDHAAQWPPSWGLMNGSGVWGALSQIRDGYKIIPGGVGGPGNPIDKLAFDGHDPDIVLASTSPAPAFSALRQMPPYSKSYSSPIFGDANFLQTQLNATLDIDANKPGTSNPGTKVVGTVKLEYWAFANQGGPSGTLVKSKATIDAPGPQLEKIDLSTQVLGQTIPTGTFSHNGPFSKTGNLLNWSTSFQLVTINFSIGPVPMTFGLSLKPSLTIPYKLLAGAAHCQEFTKTSAYTGGSWSFQIGSTTISPAGWSAPAVQGALLNAGITFASVVDAGATGPIKIIYTNGSASPAAFQVSTPGIATAGTYTPLLAKAQLGVNAKADLDAFVGVNLVLFRAGVYCLLNLIDWQLIAFAEGKLDFDMNLKPYLGVTTFGWDQFTTLSGELGVRADIQTFVFGWKPIFEYAFWNWQPGYEAAGFIWWEDEKWAL